MKSTPIKIIDCQQAQILNKGQYNIFFLICIIKMSIKNLWDLKSVLQVPSYIEP